MKKSTTKTASFMLSLALVAGCVPANVGGLLTGGTAIVASANEETVTYSYSLKDTVGDGWDGDASIKVYNGDTLITTLRLDDGESANGTFDLERGKTYRFVWNRGECDDECLFTITDENGTKIIDNACGGFYENGATIRVVTSVGNGEETVPYSYSLYDEEEDGWNGASITVYSDDMLIATLGMFSDESTGGTLMLERGKTYRFVWNSGYYDRECSFTITDENGTKIIDNACGDDFGDGATITEVTIEGNDSAPAFVLASLTLGDVLGLNFYFGDTVTEANAESITVKIEGNCINDGEIVALTYNETEGKYCATAFLYANQMDEEITATVYVDGVETDSQMTYSAATYIAAAKTKFTDTDILGLLEATDLLGQASDNYFDGAANDVDTQLDAYFTATGNTLSQMLAVVGAKPGKTVCADFTSDYAMVALVLDSRTDIRLYVKGVAVGTADDSNIQTAKASGLADADYPSYFEITGLNPQDLATTQTITVGGTTYTFSALTWVDRVLNTGISEKNVTLAKALLAYYDAAANYTA